MQKNTQKKKTLGGKPLHPEDPMVQITRSGGDREGPEQYVAQVDEAKQMFSRLADDSTGFISRLEQLAYGQPIAFDVDALFHEIMDSMAWLYSRTEWKDAAKKLMDMNQEQVTPGGSRKVQKKRK